MPGDVHRPREEPRIEQVQNRVLDAADILVHVHPVCGLFHVRRRFGPGRGEAGEKYHDESTNVSIVSVSRSAAPPHFGQVVCPPCRVPVERIARHVETDVAGQFDGQVLLLLGNHAAGVAMNHGDRTAPVALARKAPVTQAELGDAMAHALFLAEANRGVDGLGPGGLGVPVEGQGPVHLFRLGRHIGVAAIFGLHVIARQRHERWTNHVQPVFPREIEVALVMGGTAEDRPGGRNPSG